MKAAVCQPLIRDLALQKPGGVRLDVALEALFHGPVLSLFSLAGRATRGQSRGWKAREVRGFGLREARGRAKVAPGVGRGRASCGGGSVTVGDGRVCLWVFSVLPSTCGNPLQSKCSEGAGCLKSVRFSANEVCLVVDPLDVVVSEPVAGRHQGLAARAFA